MVIVQNSGSAGMPASMRFTLSDVPLADSFLGVETRSIEKLLEVLDPSTTAVGLVVTATYPVPWAPQVPDPVHVTPAVVVALTNDYDLVRAGLRRIEERGASGVSDLSESIRQSSDEVLGREGASSSSTGGGRRAIVLLTNAVLPLPYGYARRGDNQRAARRAFGRAESDGVPIYAYLLRSAEPDEPTKWLEEGARSTGGGLVVVETPSEFPEALSQFAVPAPTAGGTK